MTSKSTAKYIPKALLRRRRKPLAIWAAAPVLVILGICNALFAVLVAVESGDASMSLAGAEVSAGHALWIVAPAMLAVSAMMFTLGYGFLAERHWTRAAMTQGLPVAYFLIVLLFGLLTGGLLNVLVATVPAAVAVLAAVWYFRRSSTIREYYRMITA